MPLASLVKVQQGSQKGDGQILWHVVVNCCQVSEIVVTLYAFLLTFYDEVSFSLVSFQHPLLTFAGNPYTKQAWQAMCKVVPVYRLRAYKVRCVCVCKIMPSQLSLVVPILAISPENAELAQASLSGGVFSSKLF